MEASSDFNRNLLVCRLNSMMFRVGLPADKTNVIKKLKNGLKNNTNDSTGGG